MTSSRRRSSVLRRSAVAPDDPVEWMLKQLSGHELEQAAHTEYRYLLQPDPSRRKEYASNMARRYLKSKKRPSLALTKMKETLVFRQVSDLDGLRRAMDLDESPYREELMTRLQNESAYVSGYDIQGRSTFIYHPSRSTDFGPAAVRHHLWTMERAIACSRHDGPFATVNAVIDLADFSFRRHMPPVSFVNQFMSMLRSHYTGHIHKIFVVNAPASFSYLWTLVQPWVSENTRGNIVLLSGDTQKLKHLGQWYTVDQTASWMLPGGRKNRALDVDEYVAAPFDKAYDEGQKRK